MEVQDLFDWCKIFQNESVDRLMLLVSEIRIVRKNKFIRNGSFKAFHSLDLAFGLDLVVWPAVAAVRTTVEGGTGLLAQVPVGQALVGNPLEVAARDFANHSSIELVDSV